MFHIGTKFLEDTAGISILQCKTKLDAQKAEAHVPDLPKTKLRFLGYSGFTHLTMVYYWFTGLLVQLFIG
jgi:hypothetical protein